MKIALLILAAIVLWLVLVWIIRRALPFDDDSIGLPNVEPPEDERGEGWVW